MKLATWNVNSLTARWSRVSDWLGAHQPDVLLLQETKQTDVKFPFDGFRELGYHAVHHGQGQWNGVAIVAKSPCEDVVRGFGDDDPEARFVGATVDGLRVYSCYVPNGRALDNPHYEYKLRWLDALYRHLAARDQTTPTVVAGDFNVAPSDLDVYDPAAFAGATHVSPAERAAVARLAELGLTDVVRHTHPTEPNFSWWDYRQGAFRRGHGLRIDLVWASAEVSDHVTDCYVDLTERMGEKPSDHAPVVIEFSR